MEPGVVVVIGVCTFLALWYGGGHLYNRRRGQRLFRWLKDGLDVLGGEVESGWLGSPATGARINITHANPPFRRMELTLLLQNREIMPVWLLSYLRGNRDWLIIKATLRAPRQGEVEIIPAKGPIIFGLRKDQKKPWMWQEGPYGLIIGYRGSQTKQQIAELKSWLETYGMHLRRFSWRKRDPHVQVQVEIAGLHKISSDVFLADLQAATRK